MGRHGGRPSHKSEHRNLEIVLVLVVVLSHYLRAFIPPSTIERMAGATEFRTGDLAEVLSGPFQRRLSVVLHRYQESELWLVAIYYPSENCFVHTYLDEKQLKVIGHLEET
jgi:hypothetical protein